MRQYVRAATADFAGVIGPAALAPVTVAACLGGQEVEEGVAVGVAAPVHRMGIELSMELGAEFVHRVEHVLVAADPAQVIGPGAAFKVETLVKPRCEARAAAQTAKL